MKKYLFIPIVALIITACKDNTASSETEAADSAKGTDMKVMIPHSSCFMLVSGKDSFWLKLEKFETVTIGRLKYNFSEKDDSNGELDGVMKGDTLLADYTFDSEGKKSVRQVAFLVKDSVATEGIGEVIEKGGKMVFKDSASIRFNGMQLKKVNCITQ